ncbi:rRNA methyltransferase [Hallella multisaccharivorax DSM 17128]|uniref:tRNA/rRNA methyltransferase (SpoU) n=1 Tax=Hallella multisaccharivorax DSM 17128 TaxID=688246 RepID=F8NAD6_9BACT|nr:RNA methyltransferase [Hallella multisaccharivorax]EGN56799.1 tRNA/rRNA methyltransferase (SpoU) [Hallella multisaccharivorax DSM 17128]GJG30333.1 rRNA methyltransferase [Hallella multisaccharivorax DSM 17128]
MEREIITSTQNPKIKRLVLLQQKSAFRQSEGLFVVEGAREVLHCLHSGYEVDTLFVCPEILQSYEGAAEILTIVHEGCGYAVSPKVYGRIAYREGTEGVVAEMRSKKLTLDDLRLPHNPLVVVLERVEKPGNLGAVLRSADAAATDAVIVCDPLTDLYNPNLIRSSIGAVFTVPTVACTSEECVAFLKKNAIQILTAQLQDSRLYYDTDMQCGTAIVMGTESTGLTNTWREAADAHIRIPMRGQLDSLNVSVSAAILLFEAVRQRAQSGQ